MRLFFAGLIIVSAAFFAISAALGWRDGGRIRAALDGALSALLATLAATVVVM